MKKLLIGLTLLASISSFAEMKEVCGEIKMLKSNTLYADHDLDFNIVASNFEFLSQGSTNATLLATAKVSKKSVCVKFNDYPELDSPVMVKSVILK